MEADDPYPSLSDNHDYEPNLEFDDSELLNTDNGEFLNNRFNREVAQNVTIFLYLFLVTIPSNVNEPLGGILEVESPVSDGTIEENFEEELAQAPQVYTQVAMKFNQIKTSICPIDYIFIL